MAELEESDSRGTPSYVHPLSETPFFSAKSVGNEDGVADKTDVMHPTDPPGKDGGAETTVMQASPTQAPSQEDGLMEREGSRGNDTQGVSTEADEAADEKGGVAADGAIVAADGAIVQDGDPRLDPLAHSFPWAQFLIPPNLRTIDPEAGKRVEPGRLLNMLPFKVWVRHSMIGAELDNGPSRVWLQKHPLSSRDFVLDPERVKKASICWHRWLRCVFLSTMLGSLSVISTTVVALYATLLGTAESSTGQLLLEGSFVDRDAYNRVAIAFNVFIFIYPSITAWFIMSIAWEQMMRREVYYIMLHYKIMIDFSNYSWTPGRKFAHSELTQFFLWWLIGGSFIIIVWSISYGNVWYQTILVILLQTMPMFLWWDSVVKQEWNLVPINKFFEMKRDSGEGMDLHYGLDYLKDCTVVPEETFRALAAHVEGSCLMSTVQNCCPLPLFIYGTCKPDGRKDPTPGLLNILREQVRSDSLMASRRSNAHQSSCFDVFGGFGLLRDPIGCNQLMAHQSFWQGRLWWKQRYSYKAEKYLTPHKSAAVCCRTISWAQSHWGSTMMRTVLPFTDELWEIHGLINKYNCWAGSTWVILLWAAFGAILFAGSTYTSSSKAAAESAAANATDTMLSTPTPDPTCSCVAA